jgi:hypothetical protein
MCDRRVLDASQRGAFGLPGLWIILLGILGYGYLTDFQTIPVWFMGPFLSSAR